MPYLAFLNLGATELALIAVLLVMFFGIDKLPAAARALGRAQAEWSRAKKDIERELRTEEERELSKQREFERQREAQVRHASPEVLEEQRVREAARALGIADAETAPLVDLRRRVADAVGAGRSSAAGAAKELDATPVQPLARDPPVG